LDEDEDEQGGAKEGEDITVEDIEDEEKEKDESNTAIKNE